MRWQIGRGFPLQPPAAIQSSSYRSHLKSKHPERQEAEGKEGQVFQVDADSDLVLPGVILVGLEKNDKEPKDNPHHLVLATSTPFEDISVVPSGSLEMQL